MGNAWAVPGLYINATSSLPYPASSQFSSQALNPNKAGPPSCLTILETTSCESNIKGPEDGN